MQLKQYDTVIVGGGAAGLLAAGRAAELGGKVLVIEKMKQAGRKLLITGKGRCNITNVAAMSDYYKNIFPNGKFLKHAFSTFFSPDIINFFEEKGVKTVVERGGRVFPQSNKSIDVLNALLTYCADNKVDFAYNSKAQSLITENNKVKGINIISGEKNYTIFSEKVILCTGGKSYPATGSTGDGYKIAKNVGHNIENVRPALVPLITKGSMAKQLQGLSLKNVKAVVWINNKKRAEDFGEMLFTHFGLSGPIILSLSRIAVDELANNSNVIITIDLKPALDEQKLDKRLLRDIDEFGKKQIKHLFKLWLPSKLIPLFFSELGISEDLISNQLKSDQRRKAMLMMKNLSFTVVDHLSFNDAIISAGGISLKEINNKTMESLLVKNLYFAGEIIDIDANTGGYNLQVAWSTAWLAASSSCT